MPLLSPIGTLPPLGDVPEKMYAQVIRQERFGDPRNAFQIEEIDIPPLQSHEVLIATMAAGVNFNNVWAARGIPVDVIGIRQKVNSSTMTSLMGDPYNFHIGGSDVSGIVYAIGEWRRRDSLPDVKFGGPRGGRSTLFRLEMLDHLPVLILAEGEFDVMLLWEYCPDFCDAGTLGGASARFDALDLVLLTRYLTVLVVHDDDRAGEEGRRYIATLQSRIGRIISIPPPAHDLTDFWKSGGDLRAWAAGHVLRVLEDVLKGLQLEGPVMERLVRVLEIARRDAIEIR